MLRSNSSRIKTIGTICLYYFVAEPQTLSLLHQKEEGAQGAAACLFEKKGHSPIYAFLLNYKYKPAVCKKEIILLHPQSP